tara:strand:- start:870 stop:2171 length:1302 start_codon:yes stop_codon:yes gene_type:complete
MKNFLQFINETTATQQAVRLGLEGDGHGGWYKDGEFVAKTEKGRLKFYNKRQKVGEKDPKQSEKEKNLSSPNTQAPPEGQKVQSPAASASVEPQSQAQSTGKELAPDDPDAPAVFDGPPPVEKTKGTLTIAFGRFNPPTTGHQKLLDTVATSSDDGDYMIVPSRSNDPKKNPLDADTKVSLMRQMFPMHSERIVNDTGNRTIFDVLKKAHNDGYSGIRIVGGGDRVSEFEKLANTYNGKLYQFDNVDVRSAGDRDPDSDDLEGMSASKQRKLAAEGNFNEFLKGVPVGLSREQAKEFYNTLRSSMKIEEGWNLWEIAPKFDWKNLRENYIKKKIFNIGQLVENLNTGLVGRILRRGANHLICVTEDNVMFKSWIKDVTVTKKIKEQKLTQVSGVPADQRLVGTDALRKYTEKLTPGSEWGKHFINKYRKKVRK